MSAALPMLWLACASVVILGAVRARSTTWGLRTGLAGVAVLYLLGGAAANALFLATGEDYADFADGSAFAFVRDTWRSLVVPHHTFFIGLLVAFELVVGLLVLRGGRAAQLGLASAIAFHVALVAFGWAFLLWSTPMVVALSALLAALRTATVTRYDGPRRASERS